MQRHRLRSSGLWPLAAAAAIVVAFVLLNLGAYNGFFQDDELDTLSWAPALPTRDFLTGLVKPMFAVDNFRPTAALYFALMGNWFGLNFAPYITPVFAFHLLNGVLAYLLMQKLRIEQWCAIAGAAFFVLSAAALDAYWKPMYVYDLLCTTFSLLCLLLYARRRWILSFIAFWLAYKAKELAVMLPAVLVVYEYWFGDRRFKVLIPFVVASLNFGIQGILRNPNHDNAYTLRFTPDALRHTVPFYAHRLFMFRESGLLLAVLLFLVDRRIWFGLVAMITLMAPLLVLPGRLFEAYAYLPLAFAAIAMAAAASRWNPVWAWVVLAVWMPFNVRQIHRESRAILASDNRIFGFVEEMANWAARHPEPGIFVYDGVPMGFHDWGVTGAWRILHHDPGLRAWFSKSPEGQQALAREALSYGAWDRTMQELKISSHPAP